MTPPPPPSPVTQLTLVTDAHGMPILVRFPDGNDLAPAALIARLAEAADCAAALGAARRVSSPYVSDQIDLADGLPLYMPQFDYAVTTQVSVHVRSVCESIACYKRGHYLRTMKTQPRPDSIDDAELRRRQLRILRRILAALYAEAVAFGFVPENLAAHIEATEARIAVLAKEDEDG